MFEFVFGPFSISILICLIRDGLTGELGLSHPPTSCLFALNYLIPLVKHGILL